MTSSYALKTFYRRVGYNPKTGILKPAYLYSPSVRHRYGVCLPRVPKLDFTPQDAKLGWTINLRGNDVLIYDLFLGEVWKPSNDSWSAQIFKLDKADSLPTLSTRLKLSRMKAISDGEEPTPMEKVAEVIRCDNFCTRPEASQWVVKHAFTKAVFKEMRMPFLHPLEQLASLSE